MTAAHIYFIIAILLMTESYTCMYWRYCNSGQYIKEKVNSSVNNNLLGYMCNCYIKAHHSKRFLIEKNF